MRIIDFSDGFSNASAPSGVSTSVTSIASYASEAAFVSAKGSAAATGDIFLDTTANSIKLYEDAAWLTIATLTGTQTITNKTLDGVTVTTGIASTGIATFQDGAGGFKITNASTSTKGLVFDISGSAALKTTTIATTSSLDRTITLPNATTTLVGTDATQTLSNKTFSDSATLAEVATPSTPSAGYGKIYFKSDGFLYQLNDDGTETKVGAGSGGINYISNPDAESSVTGWSAYADAAGTSPVDGTGGSPTVTITRTTTTPLRGTGSFLLTKDAANRQGEGVSYAFTIDSADKAKILNISFDYEIASGTFTSGDSSDVRVWIYDVTNSVLIPVTPATIQGGGSLQWKFSGVFQTASNSTSYRLILHCATTSASAYTFEFDNVVVGPQVVNYGAPIGDWTAWTPTGTWSSNTTYTGYWRRVGDTMQIEAKVALTGNPTGSFTLNLPSGYSIDTAKITGATSNNKSLGIASLVDSGTAEYTGHVSYESATSVSAYYLIASTTNVQLNSAQVSASSPYTFASGDAVYLQFQVPISGWGSSVAMSNDTDTRVVAASVYGDPASATAGNPIIFPSVAFDTHGTYNATTGVYTVPVSGYYRVGGYLRSPADAGYIELEVDGATSIRVGRVDGGETSTCSGIVKVNAGQTLNLSPSATVDLTTSYLQIDRLSGPSTIAATETVACCYTTASGTFNDTNLNIVTYGTKLKDTHGMMSGSIVTIPVSGIYSISAAFATNFNATASTGGSPSNDYMYLYKDGSSFLYSIGMEDGDGDNVVQSYSINIQAVPLLAGQTLQIRSQRANNTGSLTGAASTSWFSVVRVGNY